MSSSGILWSLLLLATSVQALLPHVTISSNSRQTTDKERWTNLHTRLRSLEKSKPVLRMDNDQRYRSHSAEGAPIPDAAYEPKYVRESMAAFSAKARPQIPRWDRSAPGSEFIQSGNDDAPSSWRGPDSTSLRPTPEGYTEIQPRPPRDAESVTLTQRELTPGTEVPETSLGPKDESATTSPRRLTTALRRTAPRTPASSAKTPVTEATADGAETKPKTEDEYIPFAGQRMDAFDWMLCREMNKLAPSNAAVSPVGVKIVLGILQEAASRDASRELRHALRLPKGQRAARETFRHIIANLQEKKDGYIMKLGNRIYLDKAFTPLRNISRIFDAYYSAPIIPVNFHHSLAIKNTINSWVYNFTNGQIRNLITDEHQLDSVVSMILNVLYFKGEWLHPFPKEKIQEGDFHISPNKTVKVEYMEAWEDLYYTESKNLDAKILRIPYKGKKYSMFLLLPNEKQNFDKMLEHINPNEVRQLLHNLKVSDVHVKLPKFKFDFTIQLKEILQKVGITKIFEKSDEINLLTTKENIGISKIIQKIGFEVNEEGTEASSVVGGVLGNKWGGGKTFIAMNPFLFFIEEEKTGTVVFIGKVVNPAHNKPELDRVTPGLHRKSFISILEKDLSQDIALQKISDDIPLAIYS